VRQDVGTMRRTRKALLLALVLAFPSPGRAATITVPADRPTIQAAVDAAGAGDTILVQPGTYAGAVRIGDARHGLVLSAADPADPPVLQDDDRRGAVVTIAGVDDVKLDSLAIQGPAPGVSVENAHGAQLLNLEISSTGTAIRIRGGGRVQVVDCDVTGARAGQGIRIERSRDVLVRDVTLDGTRREGLLVRGTTGLTVLRTVVTDARGRAGIKLVRSPEANLAECVATDPLPARVDHPDDEPARNARWSSSQWWWSPFPAGPAGSSSSRSRRRWRSASVPSTSTRSVSTTR
jgi:parallel beta helix pectate lyase-like protein